MLIIHGVPFSAHTRKVIVAAISKQLDYKLVPVVPLAPPPNWTQLSPLGLIPVLQDGDVTLADSSVINLYLERRYSQHPLYPTDAASYAQALWIEEFVDSGLAPHVLRGLLMQRVFAPKFLNQPPDEALIRKSLTEMIPARFTYLENVLQGAYLAGEIFTVADIAVASMLVNFHYAGESIDTQRFPNLHSWLQRILRLDAFRQALSQEAAAARSVGGLDMRLLEQLGH